MTEEEYRSLDAFQPLPLYGERDPKCESVDTLRDVTATYTGEVFEACTLEEALSYVSKRDLDPKGAIRFSADNRAFIHVYFWRRRRPT